MISSSEFVLTDAFLSITRNDWVCTIRINFYFRFLFFFILNNMFHLVQSNGAIVVSVDSSANPSELRDSYLPRYQLGKEV